MIKNWQYFLNQQAIIVLQDKGKSFRKQGEITHVRKTYIEVDVPESNIFARCYTFAEDNSDGESHGDFHCVIPLLKNILKITREELDELSSIIGCYIEELRFESGTLELIESTSELSQQGFALPTIGVLWLMDKGYYVGQCEPEDALQNINKEVR